jgi:DNA-binding GntR family transcriptional regulator
MSLRERFVIAHHAAVSLVATANSRQLMIGISEIEALCARLVAMRASSTELVSLEMIHDAEKAAAANDDPVAYASVNEDFHAAIYAGGRNNTLQYQCR